MRYLYLLLLLQFCSYEVFSQLRAPAVEIFMGTENVSPSSKNIKFYLSAVSAVWGGERVSPTENNYYLTNDFDHSEYLVPTNNNDLGNWRGWDFVLSQDNGGTYPVYGYGLYKLTTNESNCFFYIDFRDDRFGNYSQYSPPSYGHDIDIWIKYDDLNNEFYLKSKGDFEWGNSISTGQTLTIWSIKQKGNPSTQQFPLFLIVTNQNGHPYLSWNPYHTSVSGYYVHKKLTTESGIMTTQHFTTSTSWTDTDFTIGNPKFANDEVEYWITAKLSPNTQSLEGNHVIKFGTSWIQWKISNKNDTKDFTYELNRNYPNPFNPTAIISYQLQIDGLVNIKVYDILGKVVADLVNENQVAGNYQLEFNGSNLPSGTYFFNIVSNNFTKVKKMILLR